MFIDCTGAITEYLVGTVPAQDEYLDEYEKVEANTSTNRVGYLFP